VQPIIKVGLSTIQPNRGGEEMRKLFLVAVAAVGFTFGILGMALAAPSISNGSFETGPAVPNPPGFIALAPGNPSITGWTISGNSIDYIGAYWQSSNGTHSIDLNGFGGPGATVSQTFETTVGATYRVSFDLAGNPASGPSLKTLVVSAGSIVNMPFSFDTTGKTLTNMGWTTKSFTFVATGASTTLAFTSTTAGCCYGPALDKVQVDSLTPSDADQCKDGGWQALFDDHGNRFKNQGDCVSFVATKGKNLGSMVP
jgi:choice-of-anchor C domain-containing protein